MANDVVEILALGIPFRLVYLLRLKSLSDF